MKNRLKIIRLEKGLTQEKLANLSGVSRATICGIERERVIPNGDTMCRLSLALKTPVWKIFFDFDVV